MPVTAHLARLEQRGRLAGRSPDQVFAAHVEGRMGRTDIAEADLSLAAFCRKGDSGWWPRAPSPSTSRSYYDDDLWLALPTRQLVEIGAPQMALAQTVLDGQGMRAQPSSARRRRTRPMYPA